MSESIPALKRKLADALLEIKRLKSIPEPTKPEPVIIEREVVVEVPVHVTKYVEVPVEVVKYVDRPTVMTEYIEKVVNVTNTVEAPPKIVYRDNPDHIATIRSLQAKLCQFTSQ